VLSAKQKLRLDETSEFASSTDELLRESEGFESEFAAAVGNQEQTKRRRDPESKADSRGKQPSVFLSYSSEDASFAQSLATELAHRNVGVWLDR
jgi:hypothetical protein